MTHGRFVFGAMLTAALMVTFPAPAAAQGTSALEKLKEAQRKLKEKVDAAKAKAKIDADKPASGAGNIGTAMQVVLPDHRDLFKLVMAANADVLGDRKEIAWEHYLLFATGDRTSRECLDLRKALANEFTATRLHDEVMAKFSGALKEASGAPARRVFTISGPERLGTYDFAKGRFPLTGDLFLKQAAVMLRSDRGASRPAPCSVGSMGGPEIVREFEAMLLGINIQVAETGRLAALPVDPATAESLVDHRDSVNPGVAGKGMVRLELSIEVDGRLGVKPKVGNALTLAARIVGARALEIPSGRELYVFPVSLFAPGTTVPSPASATSAPAAAASPTGARAGVTSKSGNGKDVIPETLEMRDALPLTNHRETLLILKYMPELLSEDAVLSLTKTQISMEQQVRRAIEKQLPFLTRRTEFNRKRPVFAFEWGSLSGSDRQAADAVLEAFVKEEPDWSFVQRAPGWDDRFQARVDTFVFGPEPIEWAQLDFAARELRPVYRRLLEGATQRTSTRVWFEVGLPPMAYDFARGSLGFVAKGRPGGGRDLHDVVPLVQPVPAARRDHLPASAKGASVYQFPQPYRLPAKKRASSPPGADQPPSVPSQWRDRVVIGIRAGGAALMLDRHLELSGLPMSAAEAESQLLCTSGAKARIFVDVQGIEGKTAVPKSGGGPRTSALFKATVERVLIVDDKGHILADLAPDAFKGR